MTYRTTAALALIAAGAMTLVAACGGSSSSGSSSGGNSAGGPVHGGNLVIARTADSQSMNNTTVFDNESIWIFEQIMQPLYTVTPNGKGVMPWLATSYTVSPNKKAYTFTLRKGVKFSNGKPMTSADVKFSIDQASAAAKGWGYINTAIKSVAAPSPQTVVVNLKYPWAPLLADLSLFSNAIVPANYGGQTENAVLPAPDRDRPVQVGLLAQGLGAQAGPQPVLLAAGQALPGQRHLDRRAQRQHQGTAAQGRAGPGGRVPGLVHGGSLKATSGITMNLFNSTRTDYLAFNETVKPFQDVHVRRAISYAINRAALVKAVLFGNGKPANSLFPPQVPYYQPATKGLQYNLAAAKAEMAKSSVPHGFTTTILVSNGFSDYLTIATILQSELKPLGINLKIQQLDPNTANLDQQNLKYDMTLTYWTMDIPDPDELATFAVDPNSGARSFFTAYNNPTVVKATHDAEQTLTTSARQSLYNTVQSDSAADAFMAFLYYSPYAYATTSNVHGFFVTPLGNYHLENVWMSK